MIALPLIVCVDRAAPGDRREQPREPDQFERVVETAVAWLVAAAAWIAMAVLVACVVAGWGAILACRAAVGGIVRLGRMTRARWEASQGRAWKWLGG